MPLIILLLLSLMFYDCSGIVKERKGEGTSSFHIIDRVDGLPGEGLWRQNIALFDMNGDGLLDIITPPPRKAEEGKRKPFIFIQSHGKWIEGDYAFPQLADYDYGSVAVGDLNRDGKPDVVLASHGKRIIALLNDGKGGFTEADFPDKDFKSRTLGLADINNDGWLDIVALSEFPEQKSKEQGSNQQAQGLLIGLNKQGRGWDVNILREESQFFGDSLSVGDINGDGNKDLVIAPLTTIRAYKKLLWFGNGKGNLEYYSADPTGDMITSKTGTGDVDGDGRDEIIFILSNTGKKTEIQISVFKFTAEGLIDITYDLKPKDVPIVFDLADIDSDGRDEVILLSKDGLHIYRYSGKAWAEIAGYPIPSMDTEGAFDIKIGRQTDGSWLIAYNLGSESRGNTGIRAFLLKTN